MLLIGDIYFNQSESDFSRKTASPLARPCTVTCNTVILYFSVLFDFKKSINFPYHKEHLAKAILRSGRLATDLSGKGRVS